MRPLHSLSFDSLISVLSTHFSTLHDCRHPNRINYPLPDTLMTAFAMFFFQHPSLLQFQTAMKQRRGRCNLESLFNVQQLPSETQMRELLDHVNHQQIRALLPIFFEKMRRAGWANDYQTSLDHGRDKSSYYVVALDGTDYFSSTKIACPGCLQRKDREGQTHFYHSVVAATLVKYRSHQIFPLDAEMITNGDGCEKQDCEINAGKRLTDRLRREHPQMKIIMTGDDLYSHQPFIEKCVENRLDYVFVAKSESHQEMSEWVSELKEIGGCEIVKQVEGPAPKRKSYEYHIVRQVPLTAQHQHFVTYVEVWEHDKTGKQVYHNSFVTNLEVSADNVATIVGIGRSKWKIENEQFNVQKNHGYELEHNYGHGKQNLSQVFYLLNLLAFVLHKLIERGDRMYQKYQELGESRREMWNVLRTLMKKFLMSSWGEMLSQCLDDEAEGSP